MIAHALSRRHSVLTVLDPKLLGFKLVKELYTNDLDFASIYSTCGKPSMVSSSSMMVFYSTSIDCVLLIVLFELCLLGNHMEVD